MLFSYSLKLFAALFSSPLAHLTYPSSFVYLNYSLTCFFSLIGTIYFVYFAIICFHSCLYPLYTSLFPHPLFTSLASSFTCLFHLALLFLTCSLLVGFYLTCIHHLNMFAFLFLSSFSHLTFTSSCGSFTWPHSFTCRSFAR